jgi:hypothetical protein
MASNSRDSNITEGPHRFSDYALVNDINELSNFDSIWEALLK